MANIIQAGIGQLCADYYAEYGEELNRNRALPLLLDGLKPSYRRALYIALKAPGNHMKSMDFVGQMGNIHPHGDKSIVKVETQLVRAGIFKELGNFGYYPIYGAQSGAAAPRYTSTGVESNWYDIMAPLIDTVPYMPGEVEGVMEPQYIATPLPLSVVIGGRGIGMGINTALPNFSAKSLLEAYLNDDPSLLKPYYDLELDYENSELDRLWRTGGGYIYYKYHVDYDEDSDGCRGFAITGDTNHFYPDWSQIDEWREMGQVFIRDESTGGKNRIFVGLNKYVRKVSLEMLEKEILRCTSSMAGLTQIENFMRLGIYNGEQSEYIPLRDWINITYDNYIKVVEKYKSDNIEKLEFQILVNTYLPQVAKILQEDDKGLTDEEIADMVGTTADVVAAICRKAIRNLQRIDVQHEIKKLKTKIKEFKAIDPIQFIQDTVNKM